MNVEQGTPNIEGQTGNRLTGNWQHKLNRIDAPKTKDLKPVV
jgi:hypothetical protein